MLGRDTVARSWQPSSISIAVQGFHVCAAPRPQAGVRLSAGSALRAASGLVKRPEPGDELLGAHETAAPRGIVDGGGLRGNDLVQRPALLLESRDLVGGWSPRDRGKGELGLMAHLAVPGDHNHLVCDLGETGFRGADYPFNAAAGRVIDEGIVTVPESVSDVDNIGLHEVHGDVAVGMRGRIVFERDRSAVEFKRTLGGKPGKDRDVPPAPISTRTLPRSG